MSRCCIPFLLDAHGLGLIGVYPIVESNFQVVLLASRKDLYSVGSFVSSCASILSGESNSRGIESITGFNFLINSINEFLMGTSFSCLMLSQYVERFHVNQSVLAGLFCRPNDGALNLLD